MICLRPTGNIQGTFYYYSLITGRRLHRRRCITFPITDEVVDRVHDTATRKKCPEGLNFLQQNGTEFVDVEESVEPNNREPPNLNDENEGVDNDNMEHDGDAHAPDHNVEPYEDEEVIDVDLDEDEKSNDTNDVEHTDGVRFQDAVDAPQEEIKIPYTDEQPLPPQDNVADHNIDNDVPEWRTHSNVSVENILPAGAKRNAPPPNRLGVVDHDGYGLINNGPKTVRGYLNAVTAYVDSLQRYNDVNEAIRSSS